MIDLDGLVGVALLLWAYCIFDVLTTDTEGIRNLPKWLWLIIVVLFPDIGAMAWRMLGRPQKPGWRPSDTAAREQRWAGGKPLPEPAAALPKAPVAEDPVITDSVAARDRMIAQWAAEEAARSGSKAQNDR